MTLPDLRIDIETDDRAARARIASLPCALVRGVFQRPDWLAAWSAAHSTRPPRLALVTVTRKRDETIVLALPLMREQRGATVYWTMLDDGVSDYNAPLFAPDFAPTRAELARLRTAIVERLPDADVFVIEKMPEWVGGHRNPLFDLPGLLASRFRRHTLPLAGGLEAVRARFRGASGLARKRRRLARRGRLSFDVLSDRAAVPVIERLMSWRSRRYDTRETTTDLYRRLLSDTEMGRLGVLRFDGEPIAGCFSIVDDGALRLLLVAFDAEYAAWSPGRLAIEDTIAWAIDAGFDEFDFTIGSEAFKFDFGVETDALWEVRAPLRWRGAVSLHLQDVRRTVAAFVRRSLPVLRPLSSTRSDRPASAP